MKQGTEKTSKDES